MAVDGLLAKAAHARVGHRLALHTAGIGLGTAIALATLVPMMRGLTGEDPYVPPLTYAGFAGTAVALGLAATALPARAALRRTTPKPWKP